MCSKPSSSVVLVTGAANGIGRSVAMELAKLKTKDTIAAWDIDEVGPLILFHLFEVNLKKKKNYLLFQAGLAKLKADLLKVDPSIKVCVYALDISDSERVKKVRLESEH